jgi:hypothetical protein
VREEARNVRAKKAMYDLRQGDDDYQRRYL